MSAALHQVLERAESFIAGFEDDSSQEGVHELLADLRAAIAWATPVAPDVPKLHPRQRWLLDAKGSRFAYATDSQDAYATIFRDATRDSAELQLALNAGRQNAQVCLEFNAASLRGMAQRLLSAAVDIETHPAASLATEIRAAERQT